MYRKDFAGFMKNVLHQHVYKRPALTVAEELLGKYLVVEKDGEVRREQIWECEAYIGPEDKASHASRGKTKRTEVMFGPPGQWYVYLIYGMYDMLNIVTDNDGHPAAVLIRAAGKYDGPGKLTKGLGITKADFNRKPATKQTGLWIEDRGVEVTKTEIKKTPRIGVSYAHEWADKPFRFVWEKENRPTR